MIFDMWHTGGGEQCLQLLHDTWHVTYDTWHFGVSFKYLLWIYDVLKIWRKKISWQINELMKFKGNFRTALFTYITFFYFDCYQYVIQQIPHKGDKASLDRCRSNTDTKKILLITSWSLLYNLLIQKCEEKCKKKILKMQN